MILEFLEDIKKYLKSSIISLDSNFTNLEVYDAYTYEHEPKAPEIAVYIEDLPEDEDSNSYDNENISTIVLNVYCYGEAMRIDNNTTKTSANIIANKLGEDVLKVMNKNSLQSNNSNIISSTRTSYVGAQSIDESSLYVSIIRYEIKIKNDYEIVINNQ